MPRRLSWAALALGVILLAWAPQLTTEQPYVLHMLVEDAVKPYAPKDSPLAWVAFAFVVFFGVTWAMLRSLERNGVFIKL